MTRRYVCEMDLVHASFQTFVDVYGFWVRLWDAEQLQAHDVGHIASASREILNTDSIGMSGHSGAEC